VLQLPKMFSLQESVALHFQLGPVALIVCVFGVLIPDASRLFACLIKEGKVDPCTGTEALYRPYGP